MKVPAESAASFPRCVCRLHYGDPLVSWGSAAATSNVGLIAKNVFFNIYFQSKELMNNKVFRAIYWCMPNCQHHGLIYQIVWNLYQNVLLGQSLNRMCDNMDIWQDNGKGADCALFITSIISVQLHNRMFLCWWNPCLCPHNSSKMEIGI